MIMMTDQQDQQLPRSQARQNTAPKIPKFLPIRGTSPDTARLQMGPLAAHLAAFEGMEKALVRIAADAPSLLSARNLEGETPAHHAAAAGKHDIIDMLGRIDPKLLMMQDDDGQTPAHTAGMYRHAEVLQAVGRRAPDSFMLLDNSGLSPLDLAGENAECRRAILPFLKVAWPPSPHPPGTRVAPLHSARQSQSMRLMPQPLPPPALLSANLQSAASTPLMPEHAPHPPPLPASTKPLSSPRLSAARSEPAGPNAEAVAAPAAAPAALPARLSLRCALLCGLVGAAAFFFAAVETLVSPNW